MKLDSDPAASPGIELIAATPEQAPIVANLFELYSHDFSEFYDVDLGPDGRFGYGPLSLYWSQPDRHPFLIKVESKWAGFALLKRGLDASGNPTVWDMAEFFVVRKYRRKGVGTQIAHQLWRRFPGTWEVRVLQVNTSAQHFWSRAISQFLGETVHPVDTEHDGDQWKLFIFDTGHLAR